MIVMDFQFLQNMSQNQQLLLLALAAAAAWFAWKQGVFEGLRGNPKPYLPPQPTIFPAPPPLGVPSQPVEQMAMVEPVESLDDRVRRAASILQEVSQDRQDLKKAYAMVDVFEESELDRQAAQQAEINQRAAKISVKA